ncbi:B12-binding domain-containing radical SAM protein [Myroides marinus]|uniref:B12-binding domain-containing radical SAM protein n=1 Tax=Myroides marinus TaxID=703342 RepID=UPI0007419A0C|nr:radical SAM protein [Myroides marinus]KUF39395.1 radical SAM protein [Myroides marinus]MDM1367902.1 radical SAM protein [Myroides marinus]MDM1375283.1 radical SAM protein [Myroides marinus]MDM1382475.1 radical SAM protein [Myroides marinus]
MNTTIAFITPPFTQLNTPYPATAYIKGFLNTLNIDSYQADLGIEVILKLFSKQGLVDLFDYVHEHIEEVSPNIHRILALEEDYIATIDAVIAFLQGKNPTLAHAIVQEDYLPRASRFEQLEELEWAFGTMGIQDKAKHLSTLYLEDLSDLIVETVDTNFGFSRYAERLGRSAHTFDEMYEALQQPLTYIDEITIALLQQLIDKTNPKIIGFSVPFPGNLYSSFRCAQYIKNNHPHIKITMGGGFPNTELRSLKDVRVFEFFDFITLDDGEAPLENLILYVEGKITQEELKRTLIAKDGEVVYINNPLKRDYKQAEVGTPDYSDLPLTEYISVIEVVNPMHRMWSDGRWNKLTMAHGCYWGKCTFCDISLDYIKVYEPIAAKQIVDRMQTLIEQTGETGFHFVDEAAPPALMREVALEIIRRKLTVSWWTNIRFEKSFTKDLCLLLKASGCVAVSGGLEVASDRLLKLIDKGVTVEQVARVNRNFTEAGILVHAYLMYGFPTQTAQETIDSLEMVRQLFEAGVMQSGFWHQFAMTAHSPVGMNPEEYKVERVNAEMGTFANNDVPHVEMNGAIHDKFSYGLKKSLFNFMHGMCFDWPLNEWFDFKVPRTSISPDYIFSCLNNEPLTVCKPNQKVVWLGTFPYIEYFEKKKKNRVFEMAQLVFYTKKETIAVDVDRVVGDWFVHFVETLKEKTSQTMTYQEMKKSFEEFTNEDFEPFWYSKPALALKDMALLVL